MDITSLNNIFFNLKLNSMRKLLMISIMLIAFLGNTMAQKVVTGKVTDEDKNPLTG